MCSWKHLPHLSPENCTQQCEPGIVVLFWNLFYINGNSLETQLYRGLATEKLKVVDYRITNPCKSYKLLAIWRPYTYRTTANGIGNHQNIPQCPQWRKSTVTIIKLEENEAQNIELFTPFDSHSSFIVIESRSKFTLDLFIYLFPTDNTILQEFHKDKDRTLCK